VLKVKKLLLLIIVSSIVLISGCSKTPVVQKKDSTWTQKAATVAIDDNLKVKAVDFELTTLNGQKVKLSGLLGKVVVINFFTTWCTYCKAEMPGFVDTMNKRKDGNVKFLFVDVSESKIDVTKYIRESNYEGLDPLLDSNGDVFSAYNGTGYPTTYIIDKTGHVAYQKVGELEVNDLEKEINGALGK
jgi:peroxiredoxin